MFLVFLSPLSTPAMRSALAHVIPRILWGAAAALFGVLLSSLFRAGNVPLLVTVALFGLAGLTTWRAGAGLIVVALLVPIATWFGREWNWALAWPETVVVAFLAGYAVRRMFARRREQADTLDLALHGMIAVVAASLLVQFLVLRETIGGDALGSELWQMLTADYFIGQGGFENVDAAMRLIEGLLLAYGGAVLARGSPSFAPLLVRAVVIGAVAASVLNLWRIWLGAVRLDDPVIAFLRYLGTLRFNTHYADVNAAGSYYVMALLAALALVRERMWWSPAAIVIGLSLMLSGSRAAMVAGVAAVALTWWFRSRTRTTIPERAGTRQRKAIVVALLIVTLPTALYLGLRRNVTPAVAALGIRAEFARTGLRMLESRPMFGVGIGQYYHLSGDFSSPELRAIYPHENAHNNFLQILAELGLVGFAVFLWVLGVAAVRVLPLMAGNGSMAAGVAAAVLAFVITWLAGHPLLIDAPTFSFWLLLGAAVGLGSASTATRVARSTAASASGVIPTVGRFRRLTAGLLIALAVSIPVRTRQAVAATNLEHLGIGLSGWQVGEDGVQHRLAGGTSTVFIPSEAAVVTLPLRSMAPDRELQVELRLDGRYADQVRVGSNDWRILTIQVPQRGDSRRFRALELRVRAAYGLDAPLLMVGKVQPR